MRYTYPAVFEPVSDGFSVFFPDLDGCTSAGDTLEDALVNAAEALAFHLEGMNEDRQAFPKPTRAWNVVLDKNAQGIEGQVMLVSAEGPENSERVNVYLSRAVVGLIDRYVEDTPGVRSRSAFLEAAAKQLLEAERQKRENPAR